MPDNTPAPTEPGQTNPATDTSGSETHEVESVDALPEFAQKMIRALRSEAATHRHKARTAITEAEATVRAELDEQISALREQHTATETELATSRRELVRLRAALAAGVAPELAADFAARLHGDTDEEIAADAERLKATFGIGARRGDPSQGQSGHTSTDHALADFFMSRGT